MASEHLIKFTSKAVTSKSLKDKGLVLVDFWAPWCGPCRMVGPIVEQLAEEYHGKVAIGKLNVDEEPDGAMAYGVSSIPTLILFKDGKIVDRIVGARPKPALVDILDAHITGS